MRLITAGAALVLLFLTAGPSAPQPKITTSYAMSMFGDLKYGPGFKHFEYVNPEAPKGGDVKLAAIGTFDNLNPFIIKSLRSTARGMIDTIFGNLVFEAPMQRSADEAFSVYGLLAESVELDPERTFIVSFPTRRRHGYGTRLR